MSGKNKKSKKKKTSNNLINKFKKNLSRKAQIATIIATPIAAITLVFTVYFGMKGDDKKEETKQVINNNVTQNIVNINEKYQNANEKIIDLSYSNSLYYQGQEFVNQANYEEAAEYFEKALAEHEDKHYSKRDTARIKYALGITYRYLYKSQDAIDNYTEAIGILESINDTGNNGKGGAENRADEEQLLQYEIGYVHYLRGIVYLDIEDYDRAVEDCRNCDVAVMLIEKNPGWEEWYSVAAVLNFSGRICFAVAYERSSPFPSDKEIDHNATGYNFTFEDAFDEYNSALMWKNPKVVSEEDHEDHEIVVRGYQLGVNIENRSGQQEAERWKITEFDAETATILTNRAVVELKWEMFDETIEDLEAARSIYQSLPVKDQYNICDLYWYLAMAKFQKAMLGKESGSWDHDNLNEYYELMSQSLKSNLKWRGEQNPKTAVAYENVAYALLFKKEYDNAKKHFAKAKDIFSICGMEEDVVKEEECISLVEQIREEDEQGGYWTLEKQKF